jgi:large subunit ribosomal protein L29
MKAVKLRDMTRDELRLEETKLVDQIFRLRFQVAASQAENPARIRVLRKDLARVKTVLREKIGPPAGARRRREEVALAVSAAAGAPGTPAAPQEAPKPRRKSAAAESKAGTGKAGAGKAGGPEGRTRRPAAARAARKTGQSAKG